MTAEWKLWQTNLVVVLVEVDNIDAKTGHLLQTIHLRRLNLSGLKEVKMRVDYLLSGLLYTHCRDVRREAWATGAV